MSGEDNNMHGKRLVGTIVQATACIFGAFLIAIAAWAFLVVRYDPSTGSYIDGFGRKLYENAGVFGEDLSPGVLWEIFDTGIAIISFGIITGLYSLGTRLKRPLRK